MVWVTLRQPLEISRNQDPPSGRIHHKVPLSAFTRALFFFRPFRVLRGRIFVGCGGHLWLRHAFQALPQLSGAHDVPLFRRHLLGLFELYVTRLGDDEQLIDDFGIHIGEIT